MKDNVMKIAEQVLTTHAAVFERLAESERAERAAAATKLPKFVRISHALHGFEQYPFTYEGMKSAVHDIYEPELVAKHFIESEVQPSCPDGSAVYVVEVYGTLRLVKGEWA